MNLGKSLHLLSGRCKRAFITIPVVVNLLYKANAILSFVCLLPELRAQIRDLGVVK